MDTTTPELQKPKFTTTRHAFEKINATGDMLFEVRPGVSAIDAMLNASCYLSVASESVHQSAEDSGNESLYGSALLVRMAKAVVDAAISAIECEDSERP